MPRPTADLKAAADLGQRAVKARDEWVSRNRPISDDRMAADIYRVTGTYTTRASLLKLWAGDMDPHTVAIETILSIALFLGVDPDDFGPIIAQRRKYVSALASSVPLAADQADSGMVAPSAGVVQRQNISFPRNGSGWVTSGPETPERRTPICDRSAHRAIHALATPHRRAVRHGQSVHHAGEAHCGMHFNRS